MTGESNTLFYVPNITSVRFHRAAAVSVTLKLKHSVQRLLDFVILYFCTHWQRVVVFIFRVPPPPVLYFPKLPLSQFALQHTHP